MSFTNKVIIVTGASSGIGAATAIMFAKEDANVVIVGRNDTKLKAVVQKCTKKPLVIQADVSKDADVERIIKETTDKFGKIDVLINNAGLGKFGSIMDGKVLAAYDEIFSVNVRAVINLIMLATPHLINTKGNIINISSVAAVSLPATPEWLPYTVSKAALDHLTKGVAKELAPFGIRVNSVNPGPVVTDFFENCGFDAIDSLKDYCALKRVSSSEEIGDMILYLAGDKAKGVTGSMFMIDNGYLLM